MDDAPLIPEALHSAYLDGPFADCSSCGADLRAAGAPYQIQKSWRRGEVVFELAICARCAELLARQFSEESMARLRQFQESRYRPSTDLGNCHFCRSALDDDAGYELGAACGGERLIRPVVAICARCSEGAQEGLSRQTREAWEDFVRRTVPGVPFEMEPDRLPLTF